MSYDIIIKNGLYFDGSNQPGQLRHIGISASRVGVSMPSASACWMKAAAPKCWMLPASG